MEEIQSRPHSDLYKLYAKTGRTFTEKDFWQEYAAENCETLFTDETYIKASCRQIKRDLFRKYLTLSVTYGTILSCTISSIQSALQADGGITYDTLIKAEKMYSDALGVKSHNLRHRKKRRQMYLTIMVMAKRQRHFRQGRTATQHIWTQ